MKDKVFIDTNIIVYAKLKNQNEEKYQISNKLLRELEKPVISVQVINELYNTLHRNKIDDSIIQNSIDLLISCVDLKIIDIKTIHLAWDIKKNYTYSYYDCLILASALENKCNIIYTEDLQHKQIINNTLKIINPFMASSK